MAPPLPVEKTAESPPPAAAAGEGQRLLPTPFLTKTYQLVEDPAVDDVISWNDDGSTFVVWRPDEFARDLLPKCFKHSNFSSFVRQLNTYGFRKIVPDRWEFANDCFRRGEKRLLCDIHRRKMSSTVPPAAAVPAAAVAIPVGVPVNRVASPTNSGEEQVLSSNSSPSPATAWAAAGSGSASDLVEENERLRRENSRLSEELGGMKSLCNNIFNLMSKYAAGQQQGTGTAAAVVPATELELMPAGRAADEEGGYVKMEAEGGSNPPAIPCARLFGVPIGTKRGRDEAADDRPTAVAMEVKSEPLDSGGDGGVEGQSWVVYRPRPNRVITNE